MSDQEDFNARQLGTQARFALDAIEVAIWHRAVELMGDARAFYREQELTPERAHSILIGLLEQANMASGLAGQVRNGVKASHRINLRIDAAAAEKAREAHVATHGRNRFGRSKAPPSKASDQ